MKKLRGSWENILLRGWNMALSCLDEANWSENIYLGVTLSRQRQVVDLKAITFEQEQQLLGRRYRTGFCSENYSATIKVSPPLGYIKGRCAVWGTFEHRKLSFVGTKILLLANQFWGQPHSLTDGPTRPFCKPTPATKDILKGNVNHSDGGQLLIESCLPALLSHSG